MKEVPEGTRPASLALAVDLLFALGGVVGVADLLVAVVAVDERLLGGRTGGWDLLGGVDSLLAICHFSVPLFGSCMDGWGELGPSVEFWRRCQTL